MPKINYAKLFTLRADGRYQGKYKGADGKWHSVCDRDPEKLFHRLEGLKISTVRTFAAAAGEWQTAHAEEVGWKTADTYNASLSRLVAAFGADRLDAVTPARVQAFLAQLGKRGYSRRTVQMHRDILHMIYQREILLGNASEYPTSAVPLPKGLTQTKRKPPEDEAIAAILAHPDADMAPFAFLLMMTGLRRGEALALEQGDVDRAAMVIHVRKAVEYIGNTASLKLPKTASGVRDVHFPPALLEHLPTAPGLLFPGADGGLMSKTSYFKRWRSYCREIGAEFSAHQLRHLYATYLFEADVDVLSAQAQLGHANATTTMAIYTHLRTQKRAEADDKIDAFFGR